MSIDHFVIQYFDTGGWVILWKSSPKWPTLRRVRR